MADTVLSNLDITREFLEVFHSNVVITRNLNHDYEKNFGAPVSYEGQKQGPTIQVREPIQTTVRTGWGMNTQDIVETFKPLTIDTVRGIDLKFSDADMALSIDDFSKRYVDVPAKKLGAVVDAISAEYMFLRTANTVAATAFAVPTTLDTYLAAGEKLKDSLVPVDGNLCAVVSPRAERSIVNGLGTYYNPTMQISDQYIKGEMSRAAGFTWYMSQLLPTLTTGSADHVADGLRVKATTGWVSSARSTLIYDSDSTTTGTVKAGETFTMSGVYDINYETKTTLANLKQFTVLTDTASVGGEGTISFFPAIYGPTDGALQNVSALPTLGSSTITLGAQNGSTAVVSAASTAYRSALIFHPKAFAFASVPLRMPENVLGATVSSDNFNLRFLRGFDLVNARYLSRIDIFFGLAELRGAWASKLLHI